MEIFKAGRRTYIAIPKAYTSPQMAMTKANEHFKTKIENLEVVTGMIRRGILYVGNTGTYWVIRRK